MDGLDLQVETGGVHGFLWPNGAGKTTTLRILLGLLRADVGEVQLLGGDPWRGRSLSPFEHPARMPLESFALPLLSDLLGEEGQGGLSWEPEGLGSPRLI